MTGMTAGVLVWTWFEDEEESLMADFDSKEEEFEVLVVGAIKVEAVDVHSALVVFAIKAMLLVALLIAAFEVVSIAFIVWIEEGSDSCNIDAPAFWSLSSSLRRFDVELWISGAESVVVESSVSILFLLIIKRDFFPNIIKSRF
jgi:hypothetical protein